MTRPDTHQLPLIPPGFGQGIRRTVDAPLNGAEARRARKARNAAARKASAQRTAPTKGTRAGQGSAPCA